jgi:trk system potassium uptake protein TrkH
MLQYKKVRWPLSLLRRLKATQIIAITFVLIILAGTFLLMTPAASRSGVSCGFLPALFTATSATCVTGLVVYDTWLQWSGFGQVVILAMIELGGLGFMTAASMIIFLLRKRFGLRQRLVMAQAVGYENSGGVVRLQLLILRGSLIIEAVGALALTLRFMADFDIMTALKLGVFHSVSAFCNAGFDILGFIPGNSGISAYATDPIVCIVLMALIVIGGLGFIVWEEMLRVRNFRKFSVYSRLVILTTAALIISGAAFICALEWNNPGTLGGMSADQKVLSGFFQSVTSRTAGFTAINQAELTDAGKVATMFLMLIGGSSGSTAGGIKTVTLVVITLFMAARARGRGTVNVFSRTIPQEQVLNALTIFGIMIFLAVFGGAFICATSPVGFVDALYESISALATVGLSANVTTKLSMASKILVIIYMYFGRVGILTISMGFLAGNQAEERYRYAETKLLIG